ncbi:MAG: pentapeptide repeat-containing protein, partial [Anaerolineales bacterium]|nr:pentapeptide repeat-containing protein [Anaerolineales bacterium]
MTKRLLVAYATGSGSTAEVAAAIAAELAVEGTAVDVRLAREVEAVDAYSGVVLGSSIRVGRWLPDAVDFLEDFGDTLADVPVAYFTTCLTMVTDDEDSRRIVMAYLEPIRQLAPEVHPVGLGLFAGSLSPNMQQIMPGHPGPFGDFRNWEAIRAWAAEIRPALLAGEVRLAAPIVLTGAVLSYTDMSGLNLQHVDLQEAELVEATLRDADLLGADLR